MSTLTGITGVAAPTVAAATANRAPAENAIPPPVPAEAASSMPEAGSAANAELAAAVLALRAALAAGPDAEREVELRHADDGSFAVEIRIKATGRLVQAFPPEILLNRYRHSADLLGVLIDDSR